MHNSFGIGICLLQEKKIDRVFLRLFAYKTYCRGENTLIFPSIIENLVKTWCSKNGRAISYLELIASKIQSRYANDLHVTNVKR